MARLAVLTFVVLRESWTSPAVAGFVERLDVVGAAAHAADGFIAAADEDEDQSAAGGDPGPWGAFQLPELWRRTDPDPTQPRAFTLLSIWRDVAAAFTFTYSGSHLEALRRRSEWMAPRPGPAYVAWWIADDAVPTWADGCARLDQLHVDGPSASAFDFHQPFDADGRPAVRPSLLR